MQPKVFKKSFSIVNIIAILFVAVAPIIAVKKVQAASFTQAYVRFDRMQASTYTSGLVCARTPVVDSGTEAYVKVVFPADFTLSTVLTDWTVDTTSLPSGTTNWPGIAQATAANNTTHTVTFPSTNLSTATTYCFRWTNNTTALRTGSAGNDKTGSITTTTSVPADLDMSNFATSIISTNDQISVTATVPPTFTFTFTGGTDNFGTLSTSASSTSGRTASVSTNAANGWVVWVKSANAALLSPSTSASIATAGTINATPDVLTGGPGYLLDTNLTTDSATAGTGTVTIDPEYNGVDASFGGGTLSTNFQPVASANGVTDGDTITLIERARISAIQKAANDYADTLTVVAAGLF